MPLNSLTIEIAGLCARVDIEHMETFAYLKLRFRTFLSENRPDFTINFTDPPKTFKISKELLEELGNTPQSLVLIPGKQKYLFAARSDLTKVIGFIDTEKKKCLLYDLFPDWRGALFTDFFLFCLYFFLGFSNMFMLHACGLVRNGKGYLFAGPSESGKTTIAGLSKGLTLLSDERLCIKKNGDAFLAYGMPWGKGENMCAEVKYIFFLIKDKTTSFNRLRSATAASWLLSDASLGALNREIPGNLLNSITNMVNSVPCYEMYFSLKDPVWKRIDELKD